MDIVIITALGVGGATIFGAVIGLICKRILLSLNMRKCLKSDRLPDHRDLSLILSISIV